MVYNTNPSEHLALQKLYRGTEKAAPELIDNNIPSGHFFPPAVLESWKIDLPADHEIYPFQCVMYGVCTLHMARSVARIVWYLPSVVF